MQVSAEDKASGKSDKVTIKSDKGRLGEDEIERMVKEAEEYAEEDRKSRERVEAKNQLEAYLYSARSSLEGVKDKLSDEECNTISSTVDEGLQWLDANAMTTKEEFDERRKLVEGVISPIVSKAYQTSGTDSSGFDDSTNSG